MDISIGFSPCPNDTYIFYAMVHSKIDTRGYNFIPHMADVEELNQMARSYKLPITKISFNAYLDLTDRYLLLDSGGALGEGCGPLLISKQPMSMKDLEDKTIAIPGEKTTANFLLDYSITTPVHKKIYLFSEIEDAILSNSVDAGVIIHENRFTYQEKGLHCIQDLGSYWEETTNSPIPLGGIIADRSLNPALLPHLSTIIRQSIEYADAHTEEVLQYVEQYAQEMDHEVMLQHIGLYVNHYSKSLGSGGRRAVQTLFDEAQRSSRITDIRDPFES